MYRMDRLWWLIRDLDRTTSQGLQIIRQGMGLKELADFLDIRRDATALLAEADRLVPADAVDGALCQAVLDAVN
jgi:hypothetical protein